MQMSVFLLTRHQGLKPDSYTCILVQTHRSNQNVPQAAKWKSATVWERVSALVWGGWRGNKGGRSEAVRYFLICVCVRITQYVW